MAELTWPRNRIPKNYISIELVGCGDASQKIACAVCYARVLREDNTYSCHLLLAKTKIVPEGMSLPRAELMACTLNVHITEIVKKSLKRLPIKNCTYVLDSEIALHWIASETKRLIPGARNQVIEIKRFSTIDEWVHVASEWNPADLGTRKGVKIEDVSAESEWAVGLQWMRQPWNELLGTQLKNVSDVKLKNEYLVGAKI